MLALRRRLGGISLFGAPINADPSDLEYSSLSWLHGYLKGELLAERLLIEAPQAGLNVAIVLGIEPVGGDSQMALFVSKYGGNSKRVFDLAMALKLVHSLKVVDQRRKRISISMIKITLLCFSNFVHGCSLYAGALLRLVYAVAFPQIEGSDKKLASDSKKQSL